MNSFVLDSFALLRFIQKEPGNEPVKAILDDARSGQASVMLNVINMGEVIYTVQRKFGQQAKLEVVKSVSLLDIAMVNSTSKCTS